MSDSPRSPGRPPTFDREELLAAAIELIDRSGPASCTLRALADSLGVTAMALYRHVQSKDDLLAQLPDHLMAGLDTEVRGATDGIDALRRVAAGLERVLGDHPNAAPLFGRPEMGPNMSAAAGAAVDLLVADGHERSRAGGLLRATVALVVGLAAGGGSSAEAELGSVASDAIEIWLVGISHAAR